VSVRSTLTVQRFRYQKTENRKQITDDRCRTKGSSASFAIRSAKSTFDEIDCRLENVALTLGCTHWGSFRRVTLPLARNGIIAGGILTWARAFGLFGPLMIFVGSFRGRTEVLSTTVYLEQSVGHLEEALAVALLLVGIAMICLVTIRLVGGRAVRL